MHEWQFLAPKLGQCQIEPVADGAGTLVNTKKISGRRETEYETTTSMVDETSFIVDYRDSFFLRLLIHFASSV